jgi:IS5 family transposase
LHHCIRRAGIEPVIEHLKSDHRLNRNFLKGFTGDQINLLMAAAAFNFRKWLRKVIFWLRFWFACAFREYDQPNGYSLRGGI